VSPRLHPEFLPTVGVLLIVTFVAGSLLSPPDPFTQLLYAGPGVVASVFVAALLTYDGGYERLGLSLTGRDHLWTVAGFLAVAVVVALLLPDPTASIPTAAVLVAGLAVGVWFGWGRGRERLGFRSRNA
jgi:Sec-independent protein secretion pathway component TatC